VAPTLPTKAADVATAVSWNRTFRRPDRWLTAGLMVAVMAVTGVLVVGGYRNLSRIKLIQTHVARTAQLQSLTVDLQQALLDELTGAPPGIPIDELRGDIDALRANDTYLDPSTRGLLDDLHSTLEGGRTLGESVLTVAVGLMRTIINAENAAQGIRVEELRHDAQREIVLSAGLLVAILGATVVGFRVFRRRVLRPLADLTGAFAPLAEGDFRAISPDHADPILQPLFENYNHLVSRLAVSEQQHRSRAEDLESEVRAAVHALLAQQRNLANAERLAAVGETAAGVAHELRNPLAGILMSLGNLRRDVEDADVAERVDLSIREIERITRLLNSYLSSARHAPEPSRTTRIPNLVSELLRLMRYEVPTHVHLASHVSDDLGQCVLPRDRIRQVLLNLVLNSVQALDDNSGSVDIYAEHRDGRLVLSILDDGPGFSDEILESAGRAFTTSRMSGTGLGLQMVRRVIHDLGGHVRLVNRSPNGAAVYLTIPCSHA
jgi:nitrogen fixation/metabolism regulation signal transduction histidine kinase